MPDQAHDKLGRFAASEAGKKADAASSKANASGSPDDHSAAASANRDAAKAKTALGIKLHEAGKPGSLNALNEAKAHKHEAEKHEEHVASTKSSRESLGNPKVWASLRMKGKLK